MKKETILGINVCTADGEQLITAIREDVSAGRQRFIVAINPEKILKARQDRALFELLNTADYQIPDGIGIILASRLKGGAIRRRVTGIDSMENLCRDAAQFGWRVFLYGAKPGVAEETAELLARRYPGLAVAGTADGYGRDEDAVVGRINASGADVVFAALGSPAQEFWITRNRGRLNARVLQGVGGSFDVICGNLRRAPRWMQKIGLEWLFRLLLQPQRIFRQLKILRFLLLILTEQKEST